jgi:pimeloyl-ACP methyl ester carboxylesterase
MWKDFPARLCNASACRGLVYSRYGYGESEPLDAPRAVEFMHHEAGESLPDLLDALGVEAPILFGHSDGGSIALVYASLAERPVRAHIVLAPHVLVEDISIRSIEAAKVTFETTDLRERLRRYHADPDSAFRGWNDVWLHPEFRDWNIEDCLPGIRAPILAIQGRNDEYGTMEQIERIARGAVHARVEMLKLDDCGHAPHRDQPEQVIAAVREFVRVADAEYSIRMQHP